MSKRRQTESKIYSKKRAAFLEANPVCQICNSRRATEVHHRLGRYSGNYLDESTWMALCGGFEASCHSSLHRNPRLSREMGYLG